MSLIQESYKQVIRQHSIPSEFPTPQIEHREKRIGNLTLHLVGLAIDQEGMVLTGSAAGLEEPPLERALFELLERYTIWNAYRSEQQEFPLRNHNGIEVGSSSKEDVFPSSPNPDKWRYSLSNGCAAHWLLREAAQRSYLELVERDCLLRSWNGELPGQPLPVPAVLQPITERFEVFSLGWSLSSSPSLFVHAFIGLPRQTGWATLFGSGCAVTRDISHTRALNEFVQSAGFLWDEEFTGTAIPSPTADYHQAWAATPSGIAAVRHWVRGGVQANPQTLRRTVADISKVSFVDLTRPKLVHVVNVVRAIEPSLFPLIFGERPEWAMHPFA